MATLRVLQRIALAAFLLAALNLVVLAIVGQYDVRLGPIHLAATYLFKPLLYLNGAFLLALALQYRNEGIDTAPAGEVRFHAGRTFWWCAVAVVVLLYAVSFTINLDFGDWTHRNITTHVSPFSFFAHRQYDGFYRPLVFLSLWLDNRIFGPALWGFHIQNVAWQLLNGYLLARLAFRLGFEASLARWAGIAFLVLPESFEAVIWPGARFDLMAAGLVLFALERALAGATGWSLVGYFVAGLCKETTYAYPLLLGGLFVLRGRLALPLPRRTWLQLLGSTFIVTVVLALIRVAIYGNLGGYPGGAGGKPINFILTPATFTSIITRMPATLFLVNTGAGLPVWLRATFIGYVVLLAYALLRGASAGRRTWLLAFPFLAVVPLMNMFGWMTPFAQQGRYLYHPAVWVILSVAAALYSLRHREVLMGCWIGLMMLGALFNTLVYVRMMHEATVVAQQAADKCKVSQCCRAMYVSNLPRDLYGAFYFGNQVARDLERDLPGVSVESTDAPAGASCAVRLRWTAENRWETLP